jgi:tRNA (cmo5U34)-methyltransferase
MREVNLQGNYDIIVAAAVLHHLRDDGDWEDTFVKLYNLTASGGVLLVSDLVTHTHPRLHTQMWRRYGEYLKGLGGEEYVKKVFDYIEKEDSPRPLMYQLDLARRVGYREVEVLHKNTTFAAYVAIKGS